MNLKLKLTLVALALIATTAGVTAGIIHAATPQDQDEEHAKMMKHYLEMAKPGKPHKELMNTVGQWNVETTTYMGGSASTSKGTATYESILGGRFVVQRTKGNMGGMPMEGFQILGYDNVHKKYVSVWLDTWSTGIHTSTGRADANGVIEMKGSMKDAMTPDGRPFRSVTRIEGADKFVVELHDSHEGKEFKIMDVVYTRVTE